MRFLRALLVMLAIAAPAQAFAQATVLQGGPTTPGHIPQYVGVGSFQPVIQDGGGAAGGTIGVNPSEIGVTARGTGAAPFVAQGTGPLGANICDYDAPIDNVTGYHYICWSANAGGGPLLTTGAGGGATPLPFIAVINGIPFSFPGSFNQITSGITPILSGTNNGVLVDSAGIVTTTTTIPPATQANITGTGTLTSGATGSGFTVNLGASTLSGQLPIVNGGTGTASPGMIAGPGALVTGSFPTQTISSISGGKTTTAVCNGVSNAATQINADATALGAAGGGFLLLPGAGANCLITAGIALPTNVYLRGQGPYSTEITVGATGFDAITFSSQGSNGVFDLAMTSASPLPSNAMIKVPAGVYGYVNDVNINNGYNCVDIDSGTVDFVEHGYYTNCKNSAVMIRGDIAGASTDVQIDHIVANCGGGSSGVTILNAGGTFIGSSDFINCGNGISITPPSGDLVQWSFFDRISVDSAPSGTGFFLAPIGSGIIKGLTCTGCWASSNLVGVTIEAPSTAPQVSGVTFDAAKIFNNAHDGVQLGLSDHVTITGGSQISGNSTISSGTYSGIYVFQDALQWNISNSDIGVFSGFNNTQGYGINIVNGNDNYVILGNNLIGNVTAGCNNLSGASHAYNAGNILSTTSVGAC